MGTSTIVQHKTSTTLGSLIADTVTAAVLGSGATNLTFARVLKTKWRTFIEVFARLVRVTRHANVVWVADWRTLFTATRCPTSSYGAVNTLTINTGAFQWVIQACFTLSIIDARRAFKRSISIHTYRCVWGTIIIATF